MIAWLRDTSDEALVQHWLSQLWSVTGIEIALNETGLWVRVEEGEHLSEFDILKMLPGAERFEVFQGNLLRAIGDTVPSRRLNVPQWYSVREMASLVLPPALPIRSKPEEQLNLADLQLRWAVTEAVEEAAAIICDWSSWHHYAVRAPLARLQHLRFAANPHGTALVIGRPVPPIPGTRLLENSRILLPSPYTWAPKVPASSIREKLGVDQDAWVLWIERDTLQTIPDCQLLGASRTSIRATQEALRTKLD